MSLRTEKNLHGFSKTLENQQHGNYLKQPRKG